MSQDASNIRWAFAKLASAVMWAGRTTIGMSETAGINLKNQRFIVSELLKVCTKGRFEPRLELVLHGIWWDCNVFVLEFVFFKSFPEFAVVFSISFCYSQERTEEVVKALSDSQWSTTAIVTSLRFAELCGGLKAARVVQQNLLLCKRAQRLEIEGDDKIEVYAPSSVTCLKLSSLVNLENYVTFKSFYCHVLWRPC